MIEAVDVHKDYWMGEVRVPALRGVSLTVAEGEFVAVMGPSGSGKSTLMNILGCLDRPTAGHYALDGVPVAELSDDELAEVRNARIGFVFQTFNLLPRMDALRNVEIPLLYAGERRRRERAQQALERVGLAGRMHHRPSEMSGGEQQRVAIARALAKNPELLLCDEPTGALDFETGKRVLRLLVDVRQQLGKTVVIITHNVALAAVADRVVRLRSGEIVDVHPNDHVVPPEEITW